MYVLPVFLYPWNVEYVCNNPRVVFSDFNWYELSAGKWRLTRKVTQIKNN